MTDAWLKTANELAASWAPAIWRASWQGGLFIAVIWLICKAFRGMPSSTKYWLWWIASLQMAVRLAFVSQVALPILPAQAPSTSIPSIQAQATTTTNLAESEIDVSKYKGSASPRVAAALVPLESPAKNQPIPKPSAALLVLAIWLGGIGACLTVSVRRLLGTYRLLRGAAEIKSGPIYDLVQELSIDHGVCQPKLLESNAALCPLLAGWGRPAIVLPSDCATDLDLGQIRMAIAHEFAHLKRRDLWFGIIPAITQTLFFFHPIAWLATHEGAAAREAACDSEALRMSGGSPAAYARLLLDTAQARSSMAVLGTAFGYRLIHRRISMLKTITGSNARRYRSAGALMIALSAICALPWTVTAQVPPSPVGAPAIPAKKIVKPPKAVKKKMAKKAMKLVVPPKMAKASTKPPHALIPPTPAGYLAPRAPVGVNPPPAIPGRPLGLNPPTAAPVAPVIGNFFPPSAKLLVKGNIPSPIRSQGTPPLPSPATTGNSPEMPTMLPAPEQDSGRVNREPEVQYKDSKLTIRFDHADIHAALTKLFESQHMNFVINSEVREDKVTCSLVGIPFQVALKMILGSVKQPLTYSVEADVYTVMPKPKD